jgi:hypothetical protein
LRRAVAFFLPAAVLLTVTCGLTYAEIQHDLRSGANDPQVQLAEDAAARLDAGSPVSAVAAGPTVDLGHSLAPFLAVYDTSGAVLASDGVLDGQPPMPPRGVLAAARESGRDIVTWQPREGVRIALVVLPWRGGTVLAGRSLRVVEEREIAAEQLAVLAWVAGLVALGIAAVIAAHFWPSPPGSPADVATATAPRRVA